MPLPKVLQISYLLIQSPNLPVSPEQWTLDKRFRPRDERDHRIVVLCLFHSPPHSIVWCYEQANIPEEFAAALRESWLMLTLYTGFLSVQRRLTN
jgi:hypothetical protein